jgi:hypothetical protein
MRMKGRDRVKLFLKIVIGIIKQQVKITLKRKNLIIELFQRIQITKSKQSCQSDSEFNRRKEVKFLKLQHNLDYINNKNSKTFSTQTFQKLT